MDVITNQFIPSQFPQFYLDKGPNFVAFVKAYYEWLEQEGNPLYYSRNFGDFHDIDKTLDEFIIHFKNEYMANLPTTVVADQRLLIKHIIDLYSSKGTPRGFELLFRILFNEDIQFYLPSQHIFKLSDNTWVKDAYIEVTDSIYLANLIGLSVYSSSSKATALVEDYNVITINNKVINVLHLSNINGEFKFGEQILSTDFAPLTESNAPLIVGSLSSVSIQNGGIFFNVGDIVNIIGSGAGALGRVAAITSENGKIVFDLINGGYGFTMNPQIIVSGGGGTGATFGVGGLVNQTVMSVNIDVINDYYNTQLDIASEGFGLHKSNTVGVFQVGEVVNAYANGIALDFAYLSNTTAGVGDVLSNATLGITSLQVVAIDNPNFVNLTGSEAQLNNANIVAGIIVSSNSGASLYVNSVLPKSQYIANGTVTTVNSTVIGVNNANGYFLPTSNLHGQTSGASAYINSTQRYTNWSFPVAGNTNLDTPMWNVLTYETLTIGSISRLIAENPGQDYLTNASVSVIEPLIYQLQIQDGSGGVWGGDANVTATALNANGIMTAIQIEDSGFGYEPNEPVTITSNNVYAASGVAVVDGTGASAGYWKNNNSFLSDENFLFDSFYYQQYSYEIVAPRMLATYERFVNDLMHPVGFAMFGRFKINDNQSSETSLAYTSTIQTAANGSTIISES